MANQAIRKIGHLGESCNKIFISKHFTAGNLQDEEDLCLCEKRTDTIQHFPGLTGNLKVNT